MPLYLGSKTVSENINMGDTVIQNTFDLFDVKWSDHIINNESWMCADDFNWIDGSVFSAAWNELKSEWDLATVDSTPAQQDVIGNITINYWKSPKGYKLVEYGGDTPETNENLLQQLYDEVGISWYYLIDTTGQIRFKLPRTKYGFVGVRSGTGNFVNESLPNITGRVSGEMGDFPNGAFYRDGSVSGVGSTTGGTGDPSYSFSASHSSSTYQDGANVQQKSTEMHLYFYLVDFVRTPLESNLNTFITETKEALNEKVNVSDYSADKTLIEKDINTLETTKITQADLDNTINTQRTNCITKIPQDIKLELSNGTLTLKAGSKVYVPNGVGVFDEVTISSDLSTTGYHDGQIMILAQCSSLSSTSINAITEVLVSNAKSGTSPETSVYYNTSLNMIYRYTSSSTYDLRFALPIAICTRTSSKITSIDQVFNGFGYIGSTVFALPDVEGLIPNGRNPDGSLNNTKFTTNSVLLFSPTTGAYNVLLTLTANRFFWNNSARYDQENNYNLNDVGIIPQLILGYANFISGRITKFNPKNMFQAADFQSVPKLVGDNVFSGVNTFDIGCILGKSSITGGLSQFKTTDAFNSSAFTDVWLSRNEGGSNGPAYAVLRISDDTGNIVNRQVGLFKENGTNNIFTIAPTPPASDNSTQIATTNWVSDPAKSTNVVHRNGNETIDGVKTFLKRSTNITPNIDTNVIPSSNIYNDFIVSMDKTANNQIGYFGNSQETNGNIISRIGTSRRKEDGSYIHTEISIGTTTDGKTFTRTPTPDLSSSDNNIVNTSWFNQKIQVVSTLPASPNANVYYFVTNA